MRRLFIYAFTAVGLILGGISLFTVTEQHTKQVAAIAAESNEITGAVTDIKDNTLTVKDEAGKTHQIMADDPKALEGLKVGDMVKVAMENGKAVSIEKVESEAPTEGAPPAEGAPEGEL